MSITDKTRKRLWGKSGNRCAISKIELSHPKKGIEDESLIGEECHICGKKANSARFNPDIDPSKIDDYDNLILLSRNYHKIVDDNPQFYTVQKLKTIKKNHEEWVKKTLAYGIGNVSSKNYPGIDYSFLKRIDSGKELLNIVGGCHGYDFDNDELVKEEEVDLIGSFFQLLVDYGDLFLDIEIGERIKIKYELNKELENLEGFGFWVFGDRKVKRVKWGDKDSNWDIAVLRVLRNDNKDIIKLGFDSPTDENKKE